MDWNTILSVIVGGLLALIPISINNRFQARERQKDREEQRKYAQMQAREKWTERDILRIMDLLEMMMKLFFEDERIERDQFLLEEKKPILAEEQYMKEGEALFVKMMDRAREIDTLWVIMARLVYSFEESAIIESYNKFLSATENWRSSQEHPGKATKKRREDEVQSWFDLNKSAGEFQLTLREKLISITEMEN